MKGRKKGPASDPFQKFVKANFVYVRKFMSSVETHKHQRMANTVNKPYTETSTTTNMQSQAFTTHKHAEDMPLYSFQYTVYSLFYRSAGWRLVPPTLQLMINTCLGFLLQNLHSSTDKTKVSILRREEQ